jgi:hypothetical protein
MSSTRLLKSWHRSRRTTARRTPLTVKVVGCLGGDVRPVR